MSPDKYTIEEVPAWMVDRGVGHIIAGPGFGSGWAHWACGVQTPYGTDDVLKEPPKRICQKCRKVLAGYRKRYLDGELK